MIPGVKRSDGQESRRNPRNTLRKLPGRRKVSGCYLSMRRSIRRSGTSQTSATTT